MGVSHDLVRTGTDALECADWPAALSAFDDALAIEVTAEALDGLARSLWWLGRPGEALTVRERAFSAFRDQDPHRAARIALWLAGEYEVSGNLSAANGWKARAERLLVGVPEAPEHGWAALANASPTSDPTRAEQRSREALAVARAHGDSDLEIRSLARTGLLLVTSGQVTEGIKHLDEAMAAATAGEGRDLETVGETCCDLILALEVVGDFQRFAQWNDVVMSFMRRHGYGPLVAFCSTCCAEIFAATGDVEGAERELTTALRTLQERGESFRCAHPAAKLAELRVLQGRFEEAERLLSTFPDHPAILRAQIDLAIARGETRLAVSLLQLALDRLPQRSLLAVPYLARLVRVADIEDVLRRKARDSLREIANITRDPRAEAETQLADARVAIAQGEPAALNLIHAAITRLEALKLSLEAARARLVLVELVMESQPELAALEARSALRSLESAGADREADRAAALLRALEGTGRAGPKRYSGLTRRELEVLDLLGEGLSNAEIAERLFISTKTAGHHVGNVLMKLHLKSRTEAAIYAIREAAAQS